MIYGGRINGDKTWRQPTDDQQGEYRAICLWKVGRQSFAIIAPSPYSFLFDFLGIGLR